MMQFHDTRGKAMWLLTGVVALLGLMTLMVACGQSENGKTDGDAEVSDAGHPDVAVVNYPLAFFTARIGGDKVKVVFPAPADEDPAFWMPDSTALATYQDADLILLNGATYAKWVDKVSLPLSKMVNTSEAFADEYRVIQSAVKHSHGPGGEHAHAGTDFNTWVNPQHAIEQARAIAVALTGLLPDDSAFFARNFAALETDLLALDSAFAEVAANLHDVPLLASHPVYGYFAERYGLKINARVWEPETVPGDHEWGHLDELQTSYKSKWMIWEGDPVAENVAELSKRGISSVVFHPCGNTPDSGDYLSVMLGNVERLKAIQP